MYQVKIKDQIVGRGLDTQHTLIFIQGIMNSYRDVNHISIEKELECKEASAINGCKSDQSNISDY